MKIALTGATGHLGAALLHEIQLRGHQVKALVRDENAPSLKEFQVEIIKGDLFDTDALERLMEGCDILIHSAALISVNGDPKGLVHKTNVDGTKLVITAALATGIKRCIHISSIHAYRQMPAWEILDEQRATVDGTAFAYDRSKLAGQKLALAANNQGMEVIVVNPTSIIGPYDFKPSLMGKAIIDIYKGRLPFIFNGGFDFCDCRDVANAILNTANSGRPGETYLLSGKWYSLRQLVNIMSAAAGKKIRVIALPAPVAKAGLPFVKLLAAIQQKEPLYSNEALEALFNGNRFINSAKAEAELGYTKRPFEQTMYDTLQWFKNKSYLV